MQNFNKSCLGYFILQGDPSHKKDHDVYLSAYEMWKRVWADAFNNELKENITLFSDDFTRQTEFGVLTYDRKAIGLMFFHYVDLRLKIFREDSYFKVWDEQLLLQLAEKQGDRRALICSNFTLSHEWRRNTLGISFKDLLGGFAVKHLLYSGCPFMVGTMRNNKGMNNLSYRQGAEPLKSGVLHHGVEVDLILYTASKLQNFKFPEVHELVEEIWNRSMNMTKPNLKIAA